MSCYVQPKVDPKFDITISKVNYSFEAAEFDHLPGFYVMIQVVLWARRKFHLGLGG